MKDITKNEMLIVLRIFKNTREEYNATSLSKIIKITRMGALKILKRLEKEEILTSRELGKAVFYNINFKNLYAREYIRFLLKRETENPPNTESKIWVRDLRQIKNADIAVLFGSILTKGKDANDLDILLVTDKNKFSSLKKEIEQINLPHTKRIHPIFQTEEDIKNNIKEEDKPLLNAIKGIVVFGEERFIDLIKK